jgi:hypothetical protein
MVRAVPFEFHAELFKNLYGDPELEGPTVAVDGIQIEQTAIDRMREMQAKARAKRESRTDAEQAE